MIKTNQFLYPLATGFFFAGSFIAAKFATLELEPLTITLLRYVVALLFLSILAFYNKSSSLKIKRRDLLGLILLGLFGIVGYHYFFFLSLKYTGVTNTAILNASSPIITGLIATVFISERLSRKNHWGIFITFASVVLLLIKGNIENLLALTINVGDGLMLLAVINWAIYSIIIKIMVKRYSSFTLTFYATLFGVVILFFLATTENYSAQINSISLSSIISILYMGVCASGLGYLFYNMSISQIGPTKTASFTYSIVPIFVSIFGWIIFRESITCIMIITMLLIILGLWLMLDNNNNQLKT